MKPKILERAYRCTDAHMTESARAIHALFLLDVSFFTTFDTTLDVGFGAEFLSKIEAAETVIDDYVVRSQIVGFTDQTEAVMELARVKYKDIKYFVQKAFPDSAGIFTEFGTNEYLTARRKPTEMTVFLSDLNASCNKYKTELIAVGFSLTAIDEILAIRADLLIKNSAKKMLKKQRIKHTEDRIFTLNSCYKTMAQVNLAAQQVFINDFAKQKQYVFLPKAKRKAKADFDQNDTP